MSEKYILITGGELMNKGAQAMVFVTVTELAKRFPDCTPVLVSPKDYRRPTEEKEQYRFPIIPSNHFLKFRKYYRSAVMLVDISGYAISSNWSPKHTVSRMINVVAAKHLGIPAYLMPQSFGPFEYKGKYKWLAHLINRIYLPSCKIVMAREENGKTELERKYHVCRNVIVKPDLVLTSKGVDTGAVYKRIPDPYVCSVPPGSVALIPNMKTFSHGNKQVIMDLYQQMIERLLSYGKTVYLVFHAVEDLAICKEIKNLYQDDRRLVLIEKELSCLEYSNLVRQFDYMVASRYHSIVLAYRNMTPAIALGWAVKYRDLMSLFNQQDYQFDVTESMDESAVLSALDKMNSCCYRERNSIGVALPGLQAESPFSLLK